MKKYIHMKKILYFVMMLPFFVASCNSVKVDPSRPESSEAEKGQLVLKTVSFADYLTVETKADDMIDYSDLSAYIVTITGPTEVPQQTYGEFSGKIIELGSGDYTITVTSPYLEPAAFEQPIYSVTEDFTIVAGEVTALNLELTPANCKVTIELTENFVKELATYEVVVSNGLGSLTWEKTDAINDFAANKAGYFLPRGLEVKVKGHRSIDDTEATVTYYVKNPQPAEHHNLLIDATVTGSVGGISITVKTEYNTVNNDILIGEVTDKYVDRPDDIGGGSTDEGGEDEPGSDDSANDPAIDWAENPYFDPWDLKVDDVIDVVITAPRGLKTFKVEVSENFKAAVAMITGAYGFPGADYIDLVEHASVWSQLGLPVGDAIVEKTEVVFSLTPFISTLCGAAGGMTVDFILIATDSNDVPITIEEYSIDYSYDYPHTYPIVTLNVPQN